MVGVILLITGVVIGMGVAWIQRFSTGLEIGLLVLALAFVVAGLLLNRRFRVPEP